jgi:hypothetical protein
MPPSPLHEILTDMVKHRPAVVAELLSETFQLHLPTWRHVHDGASELTDIQTVQVRADAVTRFTDASGNNVLAVVNEVQLSGRKRDRDEKRHVWPHYLTYVRRKLHCPTMLLVICVDRDTAAWCAEPIELGHPGWVLRPLVLGPDQVPLVTDPGQARRSVQLAVLSASSHGAGPHQAQIFRALLTALRDVDQGHFELYTDIVLAALPDAARHTLEALMNVATYEFQSDYWRGKLARAEADAKAAGEAGGEARAVLAVLDARGIDVPADARARITGCTDLGQLETWIRRAATATSITDLFD